VQSADARLQTRLTTSNAPMTRSLPRTKVLQCMRKIRWLSFKIFVIIMIIIQHLYRALKSEDAETLAVKVKVKTQNK